MAFRKVSAALTAGVMLVLAVAPLAAAETLTFSTSSTPTQPQSQVWEAWAKSIEEQTGGELKVEFYYQQALAKLADNFEAVSSGLADIGVVIPGYDRAKMPLTYLISSATDTGDQYVVAQAWQETRDQFPAIEAEDRKNNLKHLTHESLGAPIMIGDRFYPTPAAMEGQTMRLTTHWVFAAQRAGINANAARISSPETYTALEKGTISGAVTYMGQIKPFRLNEVADHLTLLDLGQHTSLYYMNLDRWNALTEEQRTIIETSLPKLRADLARTGLKETEETLEIIRSDADYPMQVLKLDSADRAVWEGYLSASYEENLIAKATEVNPAAPEIAAFYMRRIKEIAAEVAANGHPW